MGDDELGAQHGLGQAGNPVDDPSFEERFAWWIEREAGQRVTWLGLVPGERDPVGMLNMLVFARMPFPRAPETERPDRWGCVANVYVRPAHRGVEVGRAILEACTAYADEQGFARLVLSPSERSVPLYVRHVSSPPRR